MSRYITIEHHRKDGDSENWWYSPLFGYGEQIETAPKHALGEPEKYSTRITNQHARAQMALKTTRIIGDLLDVLGRLSRRLGLTVVSTYTAMCLNDDQTYTLLRTTFVLETPHPHTLRLRFDELAWMNHSFYGFDIVNKAHIGRMRDSELSEVAIVIEQTLPPAPEVMAHLRNDANVLASKLHSCAVIFIKEK